MNDKKFSLLCKREAEGVIMLTPIVMGNRNYILRIRNKFSNFPPSPQGERAGVRGRIDKFLISNFKYLLFKTTL